MASSGLGSQFGAKKETTWGTAVTVDKFFEFEGEGLSLDQTYFDGLGLAAGRTFAPQSRTKATTRSAGGDTTIVFPQKVGGFFLDLMVAPTITPVIATGTAYNSTFNIGASVPTKSATLQINKPTTAGVDTAFTYPGSVLTQATFSMEVGGALTAAFTWACKDETTPGTTPAGAALATATYVAGNDVWAHQNIAVTYNAVSVPATSITWTWEQPYALERFFLDGSGTRAKPIPNGLATVTGTVAGEYVDQVFYAAFRAGSFASLVATATGTTAISGAEYPTFTNTFAATQLRGSSPTVDGPDLLGQSVPFVVKDNGVANAPWVAVYKSSDSAAW
jgi:hypothetical protein